MRKTALALFCADIHLSDKPPIARSAESDWFGAMARSFYTIRSIMETHGVPLIVAGDIFHKYNPSAALINFAIKELPNCYAIPGNHDLPYHSLSEIDRSGYWTLVLAKKVTPIPTESGMSVEIKDVAVDLYGFPRGIPEDFEILSKHKEAAKEQGIAVVHQYIWIMGKSYDAADGNLQAGVYGSQRVRKFFKAGVFGDNHKPFHLPKFSIVNCGSLIPRNIDEKDHKPKVWMLWDDWTFTSLELDTSLDKWCKDDTAVISEALHDVEEFVQEMRQTVNSNRMISFADEVQNYCKRRNVSPAVLKVIMKSLEG